MANEYAVNQADLAAVANAIREKGGTSGALMFPGGFVDAVGAIQAGSGGNANVYTGTVTFEEETKIGKSFTIDLGLSSRVKSLFMWIDREDFLALEAPGAYKLYTLTVDSTAVSTLPPIRHTNSSASADIGDRMWSIQTATGACSASANGYAIQAAHGGNVNYNHSSWSCNEDGSITIACNVAGGLTILAASYHYIAVC